MRKTFLALTLLVASASALAQPFPSHPVTIVVPFPPGGSSDVLARILQPKLAEIWQQPVIIENKPGASANIGAAFVARSAPDGYTMLLATPAFAVSAAVFKNLTYDARRDLAPVAMLSVFPSVLVVHPSLPVKTPGDLVQYAKAHPGKLNFASAGATSAIRFAFEHLMQITGFKAVHIAYKGSAPSTQAMLSGEAHTMMMTLVDALPHIKSGKLRAIAATTIDRIPELPGLPTLAETVAPGFDYIIWHGFYVPAGTPKALIAKLNRDVNTVLGQRDVNEHLTAIGMDVRAGTPEDLDKLVRGEIEKWTEVGRIAHIEVGG
ncbi:MAG TPA: tripartite tricarboxylate transporter substrate binding protein [Burkholderiales bacterium]